LMNLKKFLTWLLLESDRAGWVAWHLA
jgi:hypothetical protein